MSALFSDDEAQLLSKLLFEAREQIDMWGDVVAIRTGVQDNYTRGLRDRIDAYRADKGWSAGGFGGEQASTDP
jgi:hypothetical protein